jgi:hypothetical protein
MFDSATAALGSYPNISDTSDVLDRQAINQIGPQYLTVDYEQGCSVRARHLASQAQHSSEILFRHMPDSIPPGVPSLFNPSKKPGFLPARAGHCEQLEVLI